MTINDKEVAARWESWYSKQPQTRCRRCDREFPNSHDGREYCSYDCTIGLIPQKAEKPSIFAGPADIARGMVWKWD